ncbi:MAG: hypothetical protein JWS12_333 [Candidatus Saccharibacteria bacterium]|nr:hypothetical protein [Candidatus Saccharibacteria bacterium]
MGRQPALGIAELESLYGSDGLRVVSDSIVQLAKDPSEIVFGRLGGSIKHAKLLTILPTTSWPELIRYITRSLPEHLKYIPEGKVKCGLSVYDLSVKVDQINKAGLEIKRVIKKTGRSVRVVPNKELALNSAQVLHNSLTGPLGLELLLIRDGQKTILAQTVAGQNIEAYARRDQARPKRDARVGMLPPKLAQTIINLARPDLVGTILDPFCGTGVVLQEALLMGFSTYGSDIDQRMVEFTRENVVTWLLNDDDTGRVQLEHGDATAHVWETPFDAIATETYLGQPFSAPPSPDKLHEVTQTCNTITKKFLRNLAKQTSPGFRLCLAVPAWKTVRGFTHLPTLEKLAELGYNRVSFVHVSDHDLLYYRPDQIVARELVTLIRK